MPIRALANRYPLATFVALTYAWSWTCWLTVRATLGPAPGDQSPLWIGLLILGAIGPSLGALATAAIRSGRRSCCAPSPSC